ncbi:MAG: NADP-dependent oxidoreductase [Candidatus Dormibacteria bacterium]
MRAAFYEAFGGPEQLKVGDLPQPEGDGTHLVIRAEAAGLGFWDVKQLQGLFGTKMRMPVIAGYEAAGVVEYAPEGAPFMRGDRVFATPPFPGGACAEFVRARVDHAAPAPTSVDAADAAALVVSATTAYEGIVDRSDVAQNTTVLVTAASGSVGLNAVQIAVARNARVFAVAGPSSHELLRSYGVAGVYDYHDPGWADAVRVDSAGVDVIFDAAGGDTAAAALTTAKTEATLLTVIADQAPPTFGRPFEFFSAEATDTRLTAVAELVDSGRLRPMVATRVPLVEIAQGFARIAGRHPGGKVVVSID